MRVCTSCRRLLGGDAAACPDDGALVATVATLPRGTRLGAYRIERMLGEGGMAFVYEAMHEDLHRRTAIKMLRPEFANQHPIATRFLNEAKAVNLIAHQNIVEIYNFGENPDGSAYLVMEYLAGETLQQWLHRRRTLPVPLVVHVFGQIARALDAAHGKQIVHRDLKPSNVYIVAREDQPYFVKLLDFGIAQLRGEGAVHGLTLAGAAIGTPPYMSPEQISGGAVDVRSDLWAMGVMMYRAVTGGMPFAGESFSELADRIVHHSPPPAEQLVALPPSLARLIASCLERRIEERCASARSLLAGLELAMRECGLDGEALLAAVAQDAGAGGGAVTLPPVAAHRAPAGSPRGHPGAEARRGAGSTAGAGRGLLRYAMGAAVLAVIGGAAIALGARDGQGRAAVRPPGGDRRTLEELITAGDLDGARALAARELGAALATGSPQQQKFVMNALAMARQHGGVPLLYTALKGPAELRVQAARVLADLDLPDAAPKLRAALDESGDRVKVELAAAMYRLGDKDARPILVRALGDPGLRLVAATAMAAAGDAGGRAALGDLFEATSPDSDVWCRAAAGLLGLGDPRARKLLADELKQGDAARVVRAAEVLARAGDATARAQLARSSADRAFARRGEAALALARLGDRRALTWVNDGMASVDPDDRGRALAVLGWFASGAPVELAAIAERAADREPALRVRMIAEAALLGP